MTEDRERLELIAAFADGERVDTRALRAALADEKARDHLIDLVTMREIVRESEHQAGGRAPLTSTPARPRLEREKRAGRSVIAMAAALAMAVGLGGYVIGQQHSQVVHMAVHPPLEADVVVTVEAPPEPTQVIRLDGHGKSGDGGR